MVKKQASGYVIDSESKPQNAGDPSHYPEAKSLFLVSMGSFLLKHPLTNIWWTTHNLNAMHLALIQEANSIDVNGANFIQVQRRRLSEPINFDLQIDELRVSKLTGQANSSPAILTKRFDPQRHCWHPNPSAGDAKRRPFKRHAALTS
jgi:hypothetical protein